MYVKREDPRGKARERERGDRSKQRVRVVTYNSNNRITGSETENFTTPIVYVTPIANHRYVYARITPIVESQVVKQKTSRHL